jgi:hypothetical protein
MRSGRVWIVGCLLVWACSLGACASSTLPSLRFSPEACVVDPRIPGTWKSSRFSQLGPAWMSFTFTCDCRFDARVQLLWMRINERGQFRTTGDRVVFERPSGTMSWPYRIEQGALWLTEGPDDTHRYNQERVASCGAGKPAPPNAAAAPIGARDAICAGRLSVQYRRAAD